MYDFKIVRRLPNATDLSEAVGFQRISQKFIVLSSWQRWSRHLVQVCPQSLKFFLCPYYGGRLGVKCITYTFVWIRLHCTDSDYTGLVKTYIFMGVTINQMDVNL